MKNDFGIILADYALIQMRTEQEAETGKYMLAVWAKDPEAENLRRATFAEVIKYGVGEWKKRGRTENLSEDIYTGEEQSARQIESYLREHDGSTKVLRVLTFDANRQVMPGTRSLTDRVKGYIFTHNVDSTGLSGDYLEMGAVFDTHVGAR